MDNPVNGAPRQPPAFPGTELRRLRRLLGLTQRELAALVPVHRVTLARWECGSRRISTAADERLRAVFEELRRADRQTYRAAFHWSHDFDPWP
jgi:transcriptional regulator with XRE-family HTH domain